ncbi:MAG: type II secretion system F family protein [Pseudomonadota bacterium]
MALALDESQGAIEEAPTGAVRSGRRLKDADRLNFTEQLALFLEAGLSLHQALTMMQRQTKVRGMIALLAGLVEDLEGGKSLSGALGGHPLFPKTYISLVAAGEQGGFLPDVLTRLHEDDARRIELRAALVSAFTYPAFLVTFSVAVVIFILAFVFPRFEKLFASIGDGLPASTRLLLAFSDFITNYWAPLVLAIAAIAIGVVQWLNTEDGRRRLDRAKLTWPGVGRVYQELYTAQMFRVLSLALERGVPVVETLRACRDVVDNLSYADFITSVESDVAQGGRIADGFDRTRVVPDLAREMVRTAEESGSLALVTGRIARHFELELERRLQRFSKLIEPALLIGMGFLISILVSALILPIFKLSQGVG